MFESFAAQWTPVAVASRIRAGTVTRVRVAGADVALFRTKASVIGALLDRCPHRGVTLSKGRVTDEGTLECAFHGWQFEPGGRCAFVPLCDVPEGARARLDATALPVREIAGLVWICTAVGEPPGEPVVSPELTASDRHRTFHVEEWKTHWTRAMENMLDFPHIGWVHRTTIGAAVRRSSDRGARMEVRSETKPHGAIIRAAIDGKDVGMALEWWAPNAMVQHLSTAQGRAVTQAVYCVPIDEARTNMIVMSSRSFRAWNPVGWAIDAFNRRIIGQDRRVIESSTPPEVPPPAEEPSIATDAPTLLFRRWYFRELRAGRESKRSLAVVQAS